MEATLHALGGLLLKALPTFILVILLYLYLARVFFRPLERVLEKRYEATEGARRLAEESLAKASAKAAEYEAAIRTARGEIYLEQEQFRRQLQGERAAAMEAARRKSEAQLNEVRAQLAAEVAEAKLSLAAESETLARQIAESILRRRVA